MTYSDPVNGTTGPFAIPGAEMLYTVTVTNAGPGSVGGDSVVITDPLDGKTALVVAGPAVAFIDGAPASGLSFTYGGPGDLSDDVAFSGDGGATWNYVPVPDGSGVDTNVTHLRINPKGSMAGASVAGNPSFSIRFKVWIK
jgi:uncharacterized repeat protein (TIGR01451 family)